jgi:predicted NAD/FAD-binding protein
MRIAVIGTGIAGLGCAWLLSQRHAVEVYEAEPRLGGHTNTVDVPWRGRQVPVDTGFIVYNERNYPNLTKLFDHLAVPTHASDMSFGVSLDGGRLEYAGDSLGGLFAQKRNLLRPGFHRMLRDIQRFNRDAMSYLADPLREEVSLGDFLAVRGYGEAFCCHYLLPMGAAIWSASVDGMRAFPARNFLQFFANHGLLSINDRPAWRTVTGGAGVYVAKLSASYADQIRLATPVVAVVRSLDGVEVVDARGGRERFDQVVLACHADQALALIERPSAAERSILGAFRYQVNRAVLHQDASLMPRRRKVWSSWNYLASSETPDGMKVSVTYWLNRLQGIEPECLALVSLNPLRAPAPERVLGEFVYDHPQYTAESVAAQGRLGEIQGRDRLWFGGAHWGYGFHEDGLRSGLQVAAALGVAPPWWPTVAAIRRHAPRTMPEQAAAMPE